MNFNLNVAGKLRGILQWDEMPFSSFAPSIEKERDTKKTLVVVILMPSLLLV